MNPKVSDLTSALSDWENVPDTDRQARENLKDLLDDLSRHPVPVGSLHGLWSVGDLSAQIARWPTSHCGYGSGLRAPKSGIGPSWKPTCVWR